MFSYLGIKLSLKFPFSRNMFRWIIRDKKIFSKKIFFFLLRVWEFRVPINLRFPLKTTDIGMAVREQLQNYFPRYFCRSVESRVAAGSSNLRSLQSVCARSFMTQRWRNIVPGIRADEEKRPNLKPLLTISHFSEKM